MKSFRRWMQLRENNESVEMQVAAFLEDAIEKAAALAKQYHGSFGEHLRLVLPSMQFPSNFPPEVAGHPIVLRNLNDTKIRSGVYHNKDGSFSAFMINLTPIQTAGTDKEIDDAVEALKSAVHHESEHIHHPGAAYLVDKNDDPGVKQQATSQYMGNHGEMRGHAREMARAYAKHYPGQYYDLSKAQTLLELPYFNQTHKNYFGQPNQDIEKLVNEFLPQYHTSKSSSR